VDFFMVFMPFMVKYRSANKDERHSFTGIEFKRVPGRAK
jgi:hypothetical protein